VTKGTEGSSRKEPKEQPLRESKSNRIESSHGIMSGFPTVLCDPGSHAGVGMKEKGKQREEDTRPADKHSNESLSPRARCLSCKGKKTNLSGVWMHSFQHVHLVG
jgi:hypothetical protein